MKSKLPLVLPALFMVVVVLGCAPRAVPTGKVVVVRVSQDGTANPDPATLSWSDRLVWVSDASGDLELQFDEASPFGNNPKTYPLPAKKSIDPGSVTKKVEYKYTYRVVASGGKSGAAGDPTIIITKSTSP